MPRSFTVRDLELAEALIAASKQFMRDNDISGETMLDMYLGLLAGTALRSGETRQAFGKRTMEAFDTVATASAPGPLQ